MNNPQQSTKDFFSNRTALVVEPSDTFFSAIREALAHYGMPPRQVFALKKYAEAEQYILSQKPAILVCEYQLGDHLALGLFEKHQELFDEASRIGIIVTKDSSDSAVAEAAEGQIDAYILKPFSGLDFRKRLATVIEKKVNPSDYLKTIAKGLEASKKEDFEGALREFTLAKTLDPQPSLACYYSGSMYLKKGEPNLALKEFQTGRHYQELNYRCLIGEFDVLMTLKQYQNAHALVEIIKKNFPVTSGRLSQFFISSVFSKKFDDLNALYDLFLKLDHRPEHLVKLVMVAFMTSAQNYLKTQQFDKAMEAFEIGVKASGRKLDYLEKVVNECLRANRLESAEKFLKMFPTDTEGLVKKSQLQFRILSVNTPPEQLVDFGRKMVMEGNGTPEMAEILLRLLKQMDKPTLAETIILKISEKYPEKKSDLYKILFNEESQ